MEDSVESTEQAEALVDTLQIEAATLTDANLSGLSSSDLEQLADLEAELQCINTNDIEGIEVKQMLENDIVETEIGEQEVEIETEEIEQSISPDEILPDFKDSSLIKYDTTSTAPPPLRPLTIAPKPSTPKLSVALKSALGASNQQIVFIQSSGNSTNTLNMPGHPFKLLSAQGQSVTLPNFQNVTLANTKSGVIQIRTINKTTAIATPTESTITTQTKPVSGTVKRIIPQNKNIVAKVILGGQQGQVVLTSQSSETSQPQQIKLVSPTSIASSSVSTTARAITLAQAQQMGLLASSKVQQLLPQSSTKPGIVNKTLQTKTVKVVPQVKSPTKILPAPIQGQKIQTAKVPQRVIIRQGGQIKGGTIMAGALNQVLHIPASQGMNTEQIHQINMPGKGVQYIRFMTATTTASSTAVTNSTVKTVTQTTSTTQKAQIVPVAGITVNRSNTSTKVSSVITPPTSQNMIKIVPINATQVRPVAPKPAVSGQRLLIPATSTQSRPAQTLTTISTSALNQLQGAILPSGNNLGQLVMLPAEYVQQLQNQSQPSVLTVPAPKIAVTAKTAPQKTSVKVSPTAAKENVSLGNETISSASENTSYSRTLEPNGIRPRKPCNCTKSLCLKLYCDCFANGEFCHMCNCMNCFNNLDKEEERQRAIRNCLERNPNAFRPKIGKGRDAGESSVRKHTKGCNCKRSGCLKNYCECYEAKIACSNNCKCIGCRNIEDTMEKKNLRSLNTLPESQTLQIVPTAKVKQTAAIQDITTFRHLISSSNSKLPSNYMTNEVIEATNQCMIAQADEAERNMLSDEMAKKQILEEFGRCLVQIIECSSSINT